MKKKRKLSFYNAWILIFFALSGIMLGLEAILILSIKNGKNMIPSDFQIPACFASAILCLVFLILAFIFLNKRQYRYFEIIKFEDCFTNNSVSFLQRHKFTKKLDHGDLIVVYSYKFHADIVEENAFENNYARINQHIYNNLIKLKEKGEIKNICFQRDNVFLFVAKDLEKVKDVSILIKKEIEEDITLPLVLLAGGAFTWKKGKAKNAIHNAIKAARYDLVNRLPGEIKLYEKKMDEEIKGLKSIDLEKALKEYKIEYHYIAYKGNDETIVRLIPMYYDFKNGLIGEKKLRSMCKESKSLDLLDLNCLDHFFNKISTYSLKDKPNLKFMICFSKPILERTDFIKILLNKINEYKVDPKRLIIGLPSKMGKEYQYYVSLVKSLRAASFEVSVYGLNEYTPIEGMSLVKPYLLELAHKFFKNEAQEIYEGKLIYLKKQGIPLMEPVDKDLGFKYPNVFTYEHEKLMLEREMEENVINSDN